jgi:hypothetical protein
MTDKPATPAACPAAAPKITAPKTPATSPAKPPATLAAPAAPKPPAPAPAKPAATGVAAMPKAWHDDQAKQRAASTRFDGTRFRRKQEA